MNVGLCSSGLLVDNVEVSTNYISSQSWCLAFDRVIKICRICSFTFKLKQYVDAHLVENLRSGLSPYDKFKRYTVNWPLDNSGGLQVCGSRVCQEFVPRSILIQCLRGRWLGGAASIGGKIVIAAWASLDTWLTFMYCLITTEFSWLLELSSDIRREKISSGA